MAKSRKIRVSLHKNRKPAPRQGDLTRQYLDDEDSADVGPNSERVRAKGDLSRKRTVIVGGESDKIVPNDAGCLRGRVLSVQGLYCAVVTDDGALHRCYIRRLLKSLEIDDRGVVAAGDWVWFRPAPADEGLVYRVEPRWRLLARRYRRQQHIIAANVDQVLIVGSLVEPDLKLTLIDRYLVSAEQGAIEPLICLNKVDRVAEPANLQIIVGLYSQLGYRILVTSATTGVGIDRLRRELAGRETVVVGQSGVGKSSLLNALEPSLHLKIGDISETTQKGKHTTTTAQLLRLANGGTVVDTPGIRQFELVDVEPAEASGYFVEMRSFAVHCKMPGCTHTHEADCAVKDAVDADCISHCRYQSYLRIYEGAGAE